MQLLSGHVRAGNELYLSAFDASFQKIAYLDWNREVSQARFVLENNPERGIVMQVFSGRTEYDTIFKHVLSGHREILGAGKIDYLPQGTRTRRIFVPEAIEGRVSADKSRRNVVDLLQPVFGKWFEVAAPR